MPKIAKVVKRKQRKKSRKRSRKRRSRKKNRKQSKRKSCKAYMTVFHFDKEYLKLLKKMIEVFPEAISCDHCHQEMKKFYALENKRQPGKQYVTFSDDRFNIMVKACTNCATQVDDLYNKLDKELQKSSGGQTLKKDAMILLRQALSLLRKQKERNIKKERKSKK